ncbi:MAG: hypothetical protein ACI3XJ_12505 [Oscillospiraceae bacterium]
MKKMRVIAVFLAIVLCLGACGKSDTDSGNSGSGVDYFADQIQEAAKENAQKKAEAAEEARNEGDGSLVVIKTVEDLVKFRDRVNGGESAIDAVLEADLDLADVCGKNVGNWIPVEKYNGVFEGNGHTISGLYFVGSQDDKAGLFASTDVDAVIQNLTMENVYIDGADYAGAVVALAGGTVMNCRSSGFIRGSGRAVGGIIGKMNGNWDEPVSQVLDCVNDAQIENNGGAKGIAGGVVGYLLNADAANCRNEGTVTGTALTVGGVFGVLESTTSVAITVTDCVNTAKVDGNVYVGGFCGDAEKCILNRCKNSGDVTGYTYVGGLCGYFGGEKTKTQKLVALMENCSNEGAVSLKYLEREQNNKVDGGSTLYSEQQAGGLAGIMETSIVLNCRSAGDITCDTGKDYLNCGAGYLAVGKYQGNRNLVLNCASTAKITPPSNSKYFENSRTATGKSNGEEDSAAIFYTGDKAVEAIEPTELSAFTDGTVLTALNSFPAGVSEDLLSRLEESGLEYEVCAWKEGADHMPVLDWE